MKKLVLALSFALGIAIIGGTGCSGQKISTDLVQESFANASEEDKAAVQKGVDAANAGDYATALAILEDLQYELFDISADQQSALMDLVQQLTDKLGDGAEEAAEAAREKLEAAAESGAEAAAAAVEGAAAAAE